MKNIILLISLLYSGNAIAANTLSLSNCASGYATISFTVDDNTSDSHVIVWDGSSASTKTEFEIGENGSATKDFASVWGGSSNSNIEAYLISTSSVTASCP